MRWLHVLFLLAASSTVILAGCGGNSNAAGQSKKDADAGLSFVLTADDLPGFTLMNGEARCVDYPPPWGVVDFRPDFLSDCSVFFFRNDMLSGEGRAQIDAQALAEGKDVNEGATPGATPWPDTPTYGPFVATHHGAFVVHADVWVWTSPEAADRNMEIQGTTESLGDEGGTTSFSYGPAPAYARSFSTSWRRGRVVGIVTVIGGSPLDTGMNLALAAAMDARMKADTSVYATLPTRIATPEPTVACYVSRASNGFLVRLPAGASLTADVKAPLLAEPKQALLELGLGDLYVSDTDDMSLLPEGAQVLAPLYMQARDNDLCTDDFRLEDKMVAMAMRYAASAYLVEQNVLTEERLDDSSTQWYVSDDTLPDGMIAAYTLVQTPDHRNVYMTVFKGKEGPILGEALVNLYSADE